MKNLLFIFLGMTFLFMGCCPQYCASSGYELIPLELFDKNTGETIIDNRAFIRVRSEAGNDSSIHRSGNDESSLNLSLAKDDGMKDIVTISWELLSNKIAEFEVEYELNDNDCSKVRSVKVSELRNRCTDPDVKIIWMNDKIEKIEISFVP